MAISASLSPMHGHVALNFHIDAFSAIKMASVLSTLLKAAICFMPTMAELSACGELSLGRA